MKFSKLIKPELEKIIENANFTEDEEQIFKMLSEGKTITEIAIKVSVCERTINRKISKIKEKVSRLEEFDG